MAQPGFQLGRTMGGLGSSEPTDHQPEDDFFWVPNGMRPPPNRTTLRPCTQTLAREEDLLAGAWMRARRARAETLRENICNVAFDEWLWWWTENAVENTGVGRERVKKYYDSVGIGYTNAQLANAEWRNEHPWSAAFISWVMREAGAGNEFLRGQKHTGYFFAGKVARTQTYGSLFKTYPARSLTPQRGDLILNIRAGNRITFHNLRPWGVSHSDVVFQRNGRELTVIGGNVSRSTDDRGAGLSVGQKTVRLDADMKLFDQQISYQDGTQATNNTSYVAILRCEAHTGDTLDLTRANGFPADFARNSSYRRFRRLARP
jgi:hypothetical protein